MSFLSVFLRVYKAIEIERGSMRRNYSPRQVLTAAQRKTVHSVQALHTHFRPGCPAMCLYCFTKERGRKVAVTALMTAEHLNPRLLCRGDAQRPSCRSRAGRGCRDSSLLCGAQPPPPPPPHAPKCPTCIVRALTATTPHPVQSYRNKPSTELPLACNSSFSLPHASWGAWGWPAPAPVTVCRAGWWLVQ